MQKGMLWDTVKPRQENSHKCWDYVPHDLPSRRDHFLPVEVLGGAACVLQLARSKISGSAARKQLKEAASNFDSRSDSGSSITLSTTIHHFTSPHVNNRWHKKCYSSRFLLSASYSQRNICRPSSNLCYWQLLGWINIQQKIYTAKKFNSKVLCRYQAVHWLYVRTCTPTLWLHGSRLYLWTLYRLGRVEVHNDLMSWTILYVVARDYLQPSEMTFSCLSTM